MECCIFIVLTFSWINRLADSCAATSEAGTTTTTLAPVGCNTCTAGQITFVPANPLRRDTIDAMYTDPGPDANGCSRLIAICAGQLGYIGYMQFNTGEGGPAENAEEPQIVMAPLACQNGVWVYNGMRNVTSVNCSEAPRIG